MKYSLSDEDLDIIDERREARAYKKDAIRELTTNSNKKKTDKVRSKENKPLRGRIEEY